MSLRKYCRPAHYGRGAKLTKANWLPSWLLLFLLSLSFVSLILIFAPYTVGRPNDLSENLWPIILHWRQALFSDHAWPMWRATLMGGMPFVADPQPLLPYPPNFLLLLLPLDIGSWILVVLHLWLIGFGVCRLANYFGAKYWQSVLAAVTVMLSPVLIARLGSGHLNMLEAMSLSPWILLGVLQAKDKGLKSVFFPALMLTAQFILYLNIWYYTAFLASCVSAWRVIQRKFKLQAINKLFALIIIPLVLSAYLWLPMVFYSEFTTRSSLKISDLSIPTWSISRFAKHLVLPIKDEILATAAESMLFPGLSVLLLSGWVWLGLPRKHKVTLVIIGVVVSLIALGQRTSVLSLLVNTVPGYGLLRGTTRFWFLVVISLGLLLGKISERFAKLLVWLVVIELAFVGIWWLSSEKPNFPPKADNIIAFLREQPYPFRIYCTAQCLSQYEVAKFGGEILGGNYPLQTRRAVSSMTDAGGYGYSNYSVIYPPYQVYNSKLQPSSLALGDLATEWVISTYDLNDPGFARVASDQDLVLYKNTNFKSRVTLNNQNLSLSDYSINSRTVTEIGQGRLKLAEWYVPGWTAKSNTGETLQTKESADGLIEVDLNAVVKEVTFKFNPNSFIIGSVISLAGLMAVVFSWFKKV